MEEYLSMGHMEEIIEDNTSHLVCYLPHHAVVKTTSLTTKVRVNLCEKYHRSIA